MLEDEEVPYPEMGTKKRARTLGERVEGQELNRDSDLQDLRIDTGILKG